MAILPNSSLPLLASDQAEIIQIFFELMRQGNPTQRVPEATTTQNPLLPGNDFDE